MTAVNDNKKHELFDDARALCLLTGGKFSFKKVFTSVVDDVTERAAQNFFWFLRFEHAFRETEAELKREKFSLIRNCQGSSCP